MKLTHTILSALAYVLLVSSSGAAEETAAGEAVPRSAAEQCLDDHGAAQQLEREGLLIESREKFIACSADACPSAVRLECVHQTEKVGDKIPTAILSLRTHEGVEITEASVWLGGKKLADSLDGRAVPVNPGRYEFEFRTADGAKATAAAVLREGDDYREVSARLPEPAPKPVVAEAPAPPMRKNRTAAIVTWAVGGAALASFGTFAILGKVGEDCRPTCSDAEVDDVRLKYLVADISLATAAAAGLLGLTFYLTAPEVVDEKDTAVADRRSVALGFSGNGVQVFGSF